MDSRQAATRRWPAFFLPISLTAGLGFSCAEALSPNTARAALWRFEGVDGGVNYSFSIAKSGGTSVQSGKLTGSFTINRKDSGWLSISTEGISVTKTAFCFQSDPNASQNATQNDVCEGDPAVSYQYGYLTPISGTTQTLYFWNLYKAGIGNEDYARGLQLTIKAGAFSQSDGGVILGLASTANDNFCKQIVSGTNNATPGEGSGNAVPTGCTAAKNNLYNIQGTINSPSPAIGLGLAPLALLSLRRRGQRRLASAIAGTGQGYPASQP